VVSLSYPDARRALIDRWAGLMASAAFDGLFVCFRSQSRPAQEADQFGFNEPARADFQVRHDVDVSSGEFDRAAWRDLLGGYVTMLLAELHETLRQGGWRLGVGVARGDVLGPPLGNTTLHWRDWVTRGLVDHLVIDQNSCQCPSMWHRLWPMHQGTGYVRSYLDGTGLPPLAEHLSATYGPVMRDSTTRLFVARQWHPRSETGERDLLRDPSVAGLVFSSFRHDNAAAIARGDWRAGVQGGRPLVRPSG